MKIINRNKCALCGREDGLYLELPPMEILAVKEIEVSSGDGGSHWNEVSRKRLWCELIKICIGCARVVMRESETVSKLKIYAMWPALTAALWGGLFLYGKLISPAQKIGGVYLAAAFILTAIFALKWKSAYDQLAITGKLSRITDNEKAYRYCIENGFPLLLANEPGIFQAAYFAQWDRDGQLERIRQTILDEKEKNTGIVSRLLTYGTRVRFVPVRTFGGIDHAVRSLSGEKEPLTPESLMNASFDMYDGEEEKLPDSEYMQKVLESLQQWRKK